MGGGGETYELPSSGRTVSCEAELPQWFRDAEEAQHRHARPATSYCQAEKELAQKCIASIGMWDPECVALADAFHVCQGKQHLKAAAEQRNNLSGGAANTNRYSVQQKPTPPVPSGGGSP